MDNDQRSITVNYSQYVYNNSFGIEEPSMISQEDVITPHKFNTLHASTTNAVQQHQQILQNPESQTQYFAPTTMQRHLQENTMSGTSCDYTNTTVDVANQQQFLRISDFFHFTPNDNNFYHVIIFQEDSLDDNNNYDHGFFYQYNFSTKYYVTCKLVTYPSLENILNKGICGVNFDINDVSYKKLLTLHQKSNLEESLKPKLSYLMKNQFPDGNVLKTPNVSANIDQNYCAHPQQQINFNNFPYHQTLRNTTI